MFVLPKHPLKPAEMAEARRLRSEFGLPMKQIATRLHVSPGTVHAWTADIEISAEHGKRNKDEARKVFAAKWVEMSRERRRGYQQEGRRLARNNDPIHLAGCMLYWAEGSKSKNAIEFANSDASMVAFFRRFLVQCFDVELDRLSFCLNVYLDNGLSITEIERHWCEVLGLPRTCARKHQIDNYPTSSSGKKRNRLPHGVCALKLNDTRIIQHIYGAIQEYGGFEEPRWLDGPPRKPRTSARLTLTGDSR